MIISQNKRKNDFLIFSFIILGYFDARDSKEGHIPGSLPWNI
jgi:hypothetical protein